MRIAHARVQFWRKAVQPFFRTSRKARLFYNMVHQVYRIQDPLNGGTGFLSISATTLKRPITRHNRICQLLTRRHQELHLMLFHKASLPSGFPQEARASPGRSL